MLGLLLFTVAVLALLFGGEWLARRLKAEAAKIDQVLAEAFEKQDAKE